TRFSRDWSSDVCSSDLEDTAVTPINWPVDKHYEIIQSGAKDDRMRGYLRLFLDAYASHGLPAMNAVIMNSSFEKEQENERQAFGIGRASCRERVNIRVG